MLKASSEHRVVTPKENFILCGYEHFGILDDAKESTYRQYLGKTALSIYQSLESKLEDCTVKYGKTHICGLYSSRINSKKESDKSIKSIQLIKNQNTIVAELINITVHSTVLNNPILKV
ncbi:hypothetical protein CI105_03425 [Candidatus Izimaplasma bacterium ZiA1]|uniref:hypothetical protein n=1 Tax=Candidatus Izimoplasma sp. ZiA1 TaxID=2024899 RepID=UPI000BAA5BC8|nr:hypothetical protein CI105_03425 [Candidatus Izimaplasma bacterium ZiA1]